MGSFDGASGSTTPRQPGGRVVVGIHAAALIGAVAVIVLGAGADHWELQPLLIIISLGCISDLIAVPTNSAKLKLSGTHNALIVAAVLLGGGPAALVGALVILVGWLRWREAPHYLRNNLLVFVWFPLLGGRFFYAITTEAHLGSRSAGFYVLVFVTFVLTLAINFIGVAGYQAYLDNASLVTKLRKAVGPLIGAELFSAVLTMATVYVTVVLGNEGLLLAAVVLLVFQYLVGELLESQQRGEALHRLATFDELTGLGNRNSFLEHLQSRIRAAAQAGTEFGVMLMDLDHFKEINDTLGHHYGDQLLRQLGPRLTERAGTGGFVSRLGGDEFAILPGERTADPERLEALATEMLSGLHEAFTVDELSLEVGASIGISRFPLDGTDASTLLRHADAAMYAAKESQSGHRLYSNEHDVESSRRMIVLGDFRRALMAGEMVVHYQPIVDLTRGEVSGAEGLVRWKHPELGLLQPDSFISTIERTGLIGALTRHVLEDAIVNCAQWREQKPGLATSVNLSVRNLLDRHLLREIEHMLADSGLPPDALRLEITESMLMSDPERARRTLRGLSDLGVRISIDDFGTGYSSLANLRDLPIDELKIDRSFVTPMLMDESFLIIVRSTINLAHDLGLRVTAEGVEDERTLQRLAGLDCDLAQGFHLSRAIPVDGFADFLRLFDREGNGDPPSTASFPATRRP